MATESACRVRRSAGISARWSHDFIKRVGCPNRHTLTASTSGFSQLYVIMKGDSNPALLVAEELAQRLGIALWQLLGVEPFDGPG